MQLCSPFLYQKGFVMSPPYNADHGRCEKNVPIITSTIMYTCQTSDQTFILILINEGLWFGPKLSHSLFNQNQLQFNGVSVQDNPVMQVGLNASSTAWIQSSNCIHNQRWQRTSRGHNDLHSNGAPGGLQCALFVAIAICVWISSRVTTWQDGKPIKQTLHQPSLSHHQREKWLMDGSTNSSVLGSGLKLSDHPLLGIFCLLTSKIFCERIASMNTHKKEWKMKNKDAKSEIVRIESEGSQSLTR